MFTDQDDSFIHQCLSLPAPYKHLKNKNVHTLRPVFKALVSPPPIQKNAAMNQGSGVGQACEISPR